MPLPQSEKDNPTQNCAQSPHDRENPDHSRNHSAPIRHEAPAAVRPLQLHNPRRCYFRPAIYFANPPCDYCDVWVMHDASGSTIWWKTQCLPTHFTSQYYPPTYLWLHSLNAWAALGPILFQCQHRKCLYVLGTVVSGEHGRPPLCYLFVNYCSNDPPEDWRDHFQALPLLPNHV